MAVLIGSPHGPCRRIQTCWWKSIRVERFQGRGLQGDQAPVDNPSPLASSRYFVMRVSGNGPFIGGVRAAVEGCG